MHTDSKIFEKLGLSAFPDDEKRALLKSNFGENLERLVAEINGDYQGEYRRRKKEVSERKNKPIESSESLLTPPAGPIMQEPPPAPRVHGHDQRPNAGLRVPRIVWFIGGFLLLIAVCGLFGFNLIRGILDQLQNAPHPLASNTVQASNQAVSIGTATTIIDTRSPTQTIEPSITSTFTPNPPTETPTPEVIPTVVPLPIIEHFNDPISSVWQVTGDPIQTATRQNAALGFDGVLTTVPGQYASIATGNTAWSNYIIHLRAEGLASSSDFFLGFRVKDLNNMIAIDCVELNCNWVVIENGNKEIVSSLPGFYAGYEFTLTVVDENFKGTQEMGLNWDDAHPFLILPPKYKGKFLNGGVYLRFKDMEIDYIEILAP